MVDLDDFVEMTKKYAQGMVPSAPQDGSQVPVKAEIPKDDDSGAEVKTNKRKHSINRNMDTYTVLFFKIWK